MLGKTAAWGLDIGFSTIKTVRLHKAGGGVEVRDFDVVEIEASDDESTRPQRLKAALAELARRRKFGQVPVYFSVPGNQVFFRRFNLPAVGDRKVSEIVRYEARQQIPFPLQEVVWDYQVRPTEAGGEMVINLVAIRKEIVEDLISVLRELDLNVMGLAPAPLALLNYVRYDINPTETSLILDAGAKVTDFVIVDGESFWFRPLPVAGADITHALAQKFRIPFAEAENLKTKMAESKQAEKMFRVIEPMLRSMAGEIQRTAGFYKSLARDVRIGRVFGIGHGFRLQGLADFLSKNIELSLEMPAGLDRVRISSAVDTTWFAEEFSGMGAALGLALQGLGLAKVQMSLLPESIIREIRAGLRHKAFIAVAAAFLVLVACQYVAAGRQGGSGEESVSIGGMTRALRDVSEQIKATEKEGLNIPRKEAQLNRWARIGRENGLYSRVLGKLLTAVEDYNAGIMKARSDREGEVLLSQFLVSWEDPVSDRFKGRAADSLSSEELWSLACGQTPAKNVLYVAARFECRGTDARNMVRFVEQKLKKVPGFLSVKGKSGGNWEVGSPRETRVPYFDPAWGRTPGAAVETSGSDNAWPFWAVWRYVPEQAGADAGGAAAPGTVRP